MESIYEFAEMGGRGAVERDHSLRLEGYNSFGFGKSARSHFRSFKLTDDTVLVYLWFDFDYS